MKIDRAEVVNDSGRKFTKSTPQRIARVFINFIVLTSWQTLVTLHDGARSK